MTKVWSHIDYKLIDVDYDVFCANCNLPIECHDYIVDVEWRHVDSENMACRNRVTDAEPVYRQARLI